MYTFSIFVNIIYYLAFILPCSIGAFLFAKDRANQTMKYVSFGLIGLALLFFVLAMIMNYAIGNFELGSLFGSLGIGSAISALVLNLYLNHIGQ